MGSPLVLLLMIFSPCLRGNAFIFSISHFGTRGKFDVKVSAHKERGTTVKEVLPWVAVRSWDVIKDCRTPLGGGAPKFDG